MEQNGMMDELYENGMERTIEASPDKTGSNEMKIPCLSEITERFSASLTYTKERGVIITLHGMPDPMALDVDFSCETVIIEKNREYGLRPVRIRGLNAHGVCVGTATVDWVYITPRAGTKVYINAWEAKEDPIIMDMISLLDE